MANVILTNICNLSCPYCFAGDLRSHKTEYITPEALERAVDFLKKSHCQEIGLIGGEPTLHPRFAEILAQMSAIFSKVFVYSNGICLEKYFPLALGENICYLINVNESTVTGREKFLALEQMLEKASAMGKISQFSLGVNVYCENQSFDDVLYLCEKFSMGALRLSIVVPSCHGANRTEWFARLKPSLIHLYRQMKERNIVPKYDCNIVPPCIFTDEEMAFLHTLPGSPGDIARVTGKMAVCRPVIDIYPDLTVARCFGMSDAKHSLDEFENLGDIIRFFTYETDGRLLYGESDPHCRECYRRRTLQCYGGCLEFMEG